ncbi:MAG: hypothetical protein Q8O67_07820 [Deltaproteobacteria bacterium]|nr:hypothetical protein [Deltaproteobacteria bacterium]
MKNFVVGFGLVSLSFFAVAPAFAQSEPDAPEPAPQECTSDLDCPEGSLCSPSDCACVDDNADGACDTECPAAGICLVVEEPPPACATDSECGEGLICITETFESCSGGGSDGAAPCDPDAGNCDPPTEPSPPPECTSETVSFCAPPYFAACDVDADCGGGFACIAEEICTCEGTVSPDGSGDPAEPAPPDCSCTTGDANVCVLVRTTCTDDADCALGLVCVDESVATVPCDAKDGTTNCGGGGDIIAAERICAPEGFDGEVRTQEEVDEAQGGGDENGEDGDDEEDGDDDGDIVINCAQTSPGAVLPFAAIALLLRRRRR